MTDFTKIDKEFDNNFVHMSPLHGRDFHNRPPLYDTDLKEVKAIKSFWHTQLEEAVREVLEEVKTRVYKQCLANGEGEDGIYWITYGEVQVLLSTLTKGERE